jgi:hypothetical protein
MTVVPYTLTAVVSGVVYVAAAQTLTIQYVETLKDQAGNFVSQTPKTFLLTAADFPAGTFAATVANLNTVATAFLTRYA